MIYRSFFFFLALRVLLLLGTVTAVAYGIINDNYFIILGGLLLTVISVVSMYRFVAKRFVEIDDFFEAVKYRDFSRWFSEDRGSDDIRKLHKGFNLVNNTFRDINNERQAQFLYLQKILEIVNVGIVAYNLESGEVLWLNDSLLSTLDLPSFKNVSFVEKRRPIIFEKLFETYHSTNNSLKLDLHDEQLKVLVSGTIFQVDETAFKLIAVQNIEKTLNQNEADAWKKLLSVMTHEIMNSIAPISSLSETLHKQVENEIKDPGGYKLDLEDLDSGILSIRKRSEGLMKFAKTYRTLNKVSQINRSRILINDLFENIQRLLLPSLQQKDIVIEFKNTNPRLEVNIDVHLIEQVLINLIVNARHACEGREEPKIVVSAEKFRDGIQIKVTDNGVGIPEEILETIFVPFFSTKKTGSGIGLSLSKQIMMLHNGRIQVHSKEGRGTVMSLIF
ncbi:sensor histidine kinase [Lentiprolixibacter aurantiacus]|uniref:histidine kinase n=1 Tax=Lentiprolixibacter aurantiacus TaxID=2993939 RepID=A0AAE3SM85_9FLAO|nr:HAMP domain-containing sensor histidine kinase [Lentiprolixibacter aurantiacus]MCX2718467.1 HAMP domain-containing sensor histidine kinase [Lentiprolixibacter aurantiacus]